MTAHSESISTRDYNRLRELIYDHAGIRLGTERKTMLELRIKRRLRELDICSYSGYCEFLFSHQGMKNELVHLIDVVTTNKTDFFREIGHFEHLSQRTLPEFVEHNPSGRPFVIWSAGCSTGEEPYTMGIVLSEFAELHPSFRFRILASDISNLVLAKAQAGIYSESDIHPISTSLRRKYFMHSCDKANPRVRVVPELRRQVEFRRLNFMDEDYGIRETIDAIFCRNVMIYFDRPTQERILGKLADCLSPGSCMFVGHAETLHDMTLPLAPIAPSVYRRNRG